MSDEPDTPDARPNSQIPTEQEFRALLDLFMCSDPWPLDGIEGDDSHAVIEGYLDRVARDGHGASGWIDAYHDKRIRGKR
jgi:hypothetical protein